MVYQATTGKKFWIKTISIHFNQLNPKKKKYMLKHVYNQDRLTTLELYHKQWQLQGEQKISFLLRGGGGGSGGHSGGLNAMIDGLHHKLATIGAPSRLLQQPSFPEKKPEHPSIFLACLQIRQPNLLLHTYYCPASYTVVQFAIFFLHNRGMFLYVVYSLTASFLVSQILEFNKAKLFYFFVILNIGNNTGPNWPKVLSRLFPDFHAFRS